MQASNQKKPLPAWTSFVSGAIGGAIGCLVTCPLEVVKTRLQSSLVQIPRGGYALNSKIVECVLHIQRTEGIRGLWRGLGATLFGVIPHRYDFLKSHLNTTSLGGTHYVHLFSGFFAGAISSSVMNPVWLVKTRLQLQTNQNHAMASVNKSMNNYVGAFDATRRIYMEEGIRGFYKGLSASYVGNLEGAIQFTVYESLKDMYRERYNEDPSLNYLFISASIGKFFACISIYPHEVIRTRLREQRSPEPGRAHKYTNIFQTTSLIAREEGFRALYQGMGVHMLRSIPNTAIIFVTYEFMTKLIMNW